MLIQVVKLFQMATLRDIYCQSKLLIICMIFGRSHLFNLNFAISRLQNYFACAKFAL